MAFHVTLRETDQSSIVCGKTDNEGATIIKSSVQSIKLDKVNLKWIHIKIK